MPVELIIALLVVAALAIGAIIFFLHRGKEKRLLQIEETPGSMLRAQSAQNHMTESEMIISEIESLILKSNDGQELSLTRPNVAQSADKKYREISIRGSSALGQVVQGSMPVLAQAQTLNQIAKAAPNGLFTATGSVQNLMRYSDGTVASFVRKNNQFGTHSGFAEVALSTANPAAVVGGAMQAMAMISGQYYMNEISEQLKSVDQKLDKLIGYHHDEKVGILKSANRELSDLASKSNTDAADIIACQRLGEKCGEVYYEYHTRLEGVSVDAKERWINKAKELRDLGSSIDDNELNFTIQMCYQASVLYEKCKLAEIAIRMKIGTGQERFIAEKVEVLRKNSIDAFHRNAQQYIDEHYAPVLEKAEKIAEAKKIPLLSGNTTEEAENIQRKKEVLLETVSDDSTDLAQGLLSSLSEPKETIIMLGESPDSQRVFVLEE